jgi:hypothetical protein
MMFSTQATIERSVIRRPAPGAPRGAGVWVQGSVDSGVRGALVLSESVIERTRYLGVLVSAADAHIERSAVIAQEPSPSLGLGWGVLTQVQPETGARGASTIRQSAVIDAWDLGLSFAAADGLVEQVTVVGGVAVVTVDPLQAAVAHLDGLEVRDNARAGVAFFGASGTLGNTTRACNAIDLNAETLVGIVSALTDVGGNTCGCDGALPCKVLSSMLAPPDVL